MTPTPQPPSKLVLILEGLMTLGATLIGAFVKNPAHHDSAVNVLNTLNTVAVPIAQQLSQEAHAPSPMPASPPETNEGVAAEEDKPVEEKPAEA